MAGIDVNATTARATDAITLAMPSRSWPISLLEKACTAEVETEARRRDEAEASTRVPLGLPLLRARISCWFPIRHRRILIEQLVINGTEHVELVDVPLL